MSDQIWSDEELYIDICAEDMLNRKDESSCSDNRTNNNLCNNIKVISTAIRAPKIKIIINSSNIAFKSTL
jgi:hypothetical protein